MSKVNIFMSIGTLDNFKSMSARELKKEEKKDKPILMQKILFMSES